MSDQTRLNDLKQRWAQDPGSRLYLQLAEEHRKLGQVSDAVAVLERGLESRPNDLSGLVALGRVQLELAQLEEATGSLEAVLARDPVHMVANKLLVEAHLQRGDAEQAGQRLETYRLLNDRDPELEQLEVRLEGLKSVGQGDISSGGDEEIAAPRVEESPRPEALEAPSRPAEPAVPAAEVPSPPPVTPSARTLTAAPAKAANGNEIFALGPIPSAPSFESLWRSRKAPKSADGPFSGLGDQRPRAADTVASGDIFRLSPAPVAPPPIQARPTEAESLEPVGREPIAEVPADEAPIDEAPAAELAAPEPPAETEAPESPVGSAASAEESANTVEPTSATADEVGEAGIQEADAERVDFEDSSAPTETVDVDDVLEVPTFDEAMAEAAGEELEAEEEPAAEETALAEEEAAADRPESSVMTQEEDSELSLAEPLTEALPKDLLPEDTEAELAAPEDTEAELAAPEDTGPEEEASPVAESPAEADAAAVAEVVPPAESVTEEAVAETAAESEEAATVTLGGLYLKQGHVEEAARIFEKVLEEDPENHAALAGLNLARRPEPAKRMTAMDLLADSSVTGTIPAGLTAKKLLILTNYLKHLQGSREHRKALEPGGQESESQGDHVH